MKKLILSQLLGFLALLVGCGGTTVSGYAVRCAWNFVAPIVVYGGTSTTWPGGVPPNDGIARCNASTASASVWAPQPDGTKLGAVLNMAALEGALVGDSVVLSSTWAADASFNFGLWPAGDAAQPLVACNAWRSGVVTLTAQSPRVVHVDGDCATESSLLVSMDVTTL